jgi:hypothetical protein
MVTEQESTQVDRTGITDHQAIRQQHISVLVPRKPKPACALDAGLKTSLTRNTFDSRASHGSIQIKVIRGDLSEATFPYTYVLNVVHFDITDENQDGINEPGEHILVHNIRVRNQGGMPSPSTRSIQMFIQGTQWLEPVMSEPLQLPFSIQPGQEVTVPGVLRAFIRNEWAEKPVGMRLETVDTVQLTAIFRERLERPIPNFCPPRTIKIQYPIRLDAPIYLDCVAKGDMVRFKWMVSSVSLESTARRHTLKLTLS